MPTSGPRGEVQGMQGYPVRTATNSSSAAQSSVPYCQLGKSVALSLCHLQIPWPAGILMVCP